MKIKFITYTTVSAGIVATLAGASIATVFAQTNTSHPPLGHEQGHPGTDQSMRHMTASTTIDTHILRERAMGSSTIGHMPPMPRPMGSTTMRRDEQNDDRAMMRSTSTRQQSMQTNQENTLVRLDNYGNAAITARIASLNNLIARLSNAKNISAEEKSSITAQINTLRDSLTSLRTKINMDASSTNAGLPGALGSTSPLRNDVQSITKDYRIYELVIPQSEILAAVDRVKTIAGSLTTVAGKLQVRITAAQSAGNNVTSMQASLADLNAKIADIGSQAALASAGVKNLTPDAGATSTASSNTTALKAARAALATAQSDITAATVDAKAIVSALEAMHVTVGNITSNSTTTATGTSQQ